MKKLSFLLTGLFVLLAIYSCSSEEEEIQEAGKLLVQTDIIVDGVMTKASTEAGYTTGAGTYHMNEECTVSAYANEGYELVSFTCDQDETCVGKSTYQKLVDKNLRFVANFQKKKNTKYVIAASGGNLFCLENGKLSGTQVGNNSWRDVAYGNGKFVAVGTKNNDYSGKDYGYVTTSTDGLTWTTPIEVGTKVYCHSIAYGNGKFIMLRDGSTSEILSSTDGITWPTTAKVGDNTWSAVKFANGKFFLLGVDAYLSSSTDGVTWTTPIQIGSNNNIWLDITYGNGKYVIVGGTNPENTSVTAPRYLSTSTDGINWAVPTGIEGGEEWICVAYGNDRFIVSDRSSHALLSIDNAETWVQDRLELNGNGICDIIYSNGTFTAVGYNGIYYTSSTGGDYKNWDRKVTGYNESAFYSICAME